MSILGGDASMPPPPTKDSGPAEDAAAAAQARARREASRRGLAGLVIRPAGDYEPTPTGLSIGSDR